MTSCLSLACLYKTRLLVQSLLTATSPSCSSIKGCIFLQVLWVLSYNLTSLKSMAGWPVTCLINIWKISLHCLFIFTYDWWIPFLKGYFADGSCPDQLQVFYYQSKSVKHLFKITKKTHNIPHPVIEWQSATTVHMLQRSHIWVQKSQYKPQSICLNNLVNFGMC